MWIFKTVDCYMNYIVYIIIVVIILLIIYNWNSEKGTFTDHRQLIWDLINKPYGKKNIGFVSKGETECKRVIETITGQSFVKSRPLFLKNEITNGVLELDCFNAELKLAVEYNGEQHYKYIPHFHATKEHFYNLKYRDELKKKLCQEHGVKLIIVPYTVAIKDIEKYIRQHL